MSNFSILVKNNLKLLFNSFKNSKSKGKFVSSGVFLVFCTLLVLVSLVSNAVMQTSSYIQMGEPKIALYYAMTYSLLILLLMSTLRGATTAKTTDADLLLSLPIKKSTVILSKSVSKYLFETIPVAAFFLPFVVVYFVMVDHTVGMLLRGLFIFLLMPMFSVGISYILNFLMFKLSNRIAKPQMITTVLSLVLLFGFMYLNFSLSSSVDMGSTDAVLSYYDKLKPSVWGAEFIVNGDIVGMVYFLLIAVLPFLLGVVLFTSIFGANMRKWRSKNKTLTFTQRTPMQALYRKEFKRYFGCSIYVVNTIIGPLFTIAITVLLLISTGGGEINEMLNDPTIKGNLPIILIAAYSFMPTMTTISSSSISLEGKNISILRANPIDEKSIFGAKILVNIVMTLPTTFVCTLVAALSQGLSLADEAALVILPSMVCVLISVLGLYVNLLLPKLDWDNEVTVVKQSAAVAVALFSGMALTAIPIVVSLLVEAIPFVGKALICAVFYALVLLLLWRLILTDGKKRFISLS